MSPIVLQDSTRYPGLPIVTDGSGAVVWVETNVTQAACAYPITPSTNMGVDYAQAVADERRNLWGEPLAFLEPESEHSSASAAEGFALAGGRVTNFTCGQGLVLMKEVLYAISGKRLPVVFNIGVRALTSQALNIHCGHDDVMAVADTGWGMLFAKNAQEAGDLLSARRRARICQRGARAARHPVWCASDARRERPRRAERPEARQDLKRGDALVADGAATAQAVELCDGLVFRGLRPKETSGPKSIRSAGERA
jgi:Pyruvate flavodoxin/ferredoxin oxidoreductase, thiamine diP-bdg